MANQPDDSRARPPISRSGIFQSSAQTRIIRFGSGSSEVVRTLPRAVSGGPGRRETERTRPPLRGKTMRMGKNRRKTRWPGRAPCGKGDGPGWGASLLLSELSEEEKRLLVVRTALQHPDNLRFRVLSPPGGGVGPREEETVLG